MSLSLVICDDSNMARKQVARSLPDDWEVEITFANDGREAVKALQKGLGAVLLLDLNMPNMDGYQVLEATKVLGFKTSIIVISGDIQPEAYNRVTKLGAIDFIQKPVNKNKLTELLHSHGIFTSKYLSQSDLEASKVDEQVLPEVTGNIASIVEQQTVAPVIVKPAKKAEHQKVVPNVVAKKEEDIEISLPTDLRDCYQEIANVSMGRAGDLMARLLNVFVQLPIPNVNFIDVSELSMALSAIEHHESTSGICQGFISAGISGEALLILNDSSFKDVAALMKYEEEVDANTELELLLDLANVIIGACLNGISEQLDIQFSQGQPIVLGQHRKISELVATNKNKWRRTLAIEISYGIENYDIKCDLLLLFTEESMRTINNKVSYLID